MKLVVIAPASYDARAVLERHVAGVDLVVSEDPEELARELPDAEIVAVAARHGRMFAGLWPHARNVRWVHGFGAGIEALLFDGLVASDVVLTNSRGIFADQLGEFAMAAILWFAKDLRRLVRQQAEHRWQPYTLARVEGQTVGVVGYGGIGRAVARRAKAFGMHVLATRRTATPDAEGVVDRMYAASEVGDLVAASDYVVVCTPLTPKTRGLLGVDVLARMKSDAVLINIARGPVVDEQALVAILREKRIRGAALDVFDQEPLPPDHPLWDLENVLLSPHTADHVADSHFRAMLFFVDQLARYRRGEPLLNVVEKSERY